MKIQGDTCAIEGCGGPNRAKGTAKGLCPPHYAEYLRARPHKQCLVEGCDLSANHPGSAKGYCSKHLFRVNRHGSPTEGGRLPNGMNIRERLEQKYEVDPETGCWNWTDTPHPNGYGILLVGRSTRPAHRLSYETFVGPIPARLVIDHLCENKLCINPKHLEAVTQQVNIQRGWDRPESARIEGIVYAPRRVA